MLSKADNSFSFAIVAALVLFFIGGLLTTVVPPLVDKSWARPPAAGSSAYTPQQLQGRAIYVREGCWYCHTQQTRTLVADTKRSGWRGVDSPVSTPDEFVYDARTCSAPSAPARIFRGSAASTTRSGTGRISAIRATWCLHLVRLRIAARPQPLIAGAAHGADSRRGRRRADVFDDRQRLCDNHGRRGLSHSRHDEPNRVGALERREDGFRIIPVATSP